MLAPHHPLSLASEKLQNAEEIIPRPAGCLRAPSFLHNVHVFPQPFLSCWPHSTHPGSAGPKSTDSNRGSVGVRGCSSGSCLISACSPFSGSPAGQGCMCSSSSLQRGPSPPLAAAAPEVPAQKHKYRQNSTAVN